jgi:hypothetical protein
MKHLITLCTLITLLTSCGKPIGKQSQISIADSYTDEQGNCLVDIGHKLGGDFEEIQDNTLMGTYLVLGLQDHKCFHRWEFDINSTKDGLVLYHDKTYQGRSIIRYKMSDLPFETMDGFMSVFKELDISKRVHFDVKSVSPIHFETLIDHAVTLRRKTRQEVRFVTSKDNKDRYHYFIKLALRKNISFYYY